LNSKRGARLQRTFCNIYQKKNLGKFSVLILSIILVSSLMPLQSVSAALGFAFGPTENLSNSAGTSSKNPQLAASGDISHVVWQEGTFIFYSGGSGTGNNFSFPTDIGGAAIFPRGNPQIAASGENGYVIWSDRFFPADDVLNFKAIRNNGQDFSSPVVGLSDSIFTTENRDAQIEVSGDTLHVVWR